MKAVLLIATFLSYFINASEFIGSDEILKTLLSTESDFTLPSIPLAKRKRNSKIPFKSKRPASNHSTLPSDPNTLVVFRKLKDKAPIQHKYLLEPSSNQDWASVHCDLHVGNHDATFRAISILHKDCWKKSVFKKALDSDIQVMQHGLAYLNAREVWLTEFQALNDAKMSETMRNCFKDNLKRCSEFKVIVQQALDILNISAEYQNQLQEEVENYKKQIGLRKE